jgi:hypothetical protein
MLQFGERLLELIELELHGLYLAVVVVDGFSLILVLLA